MRICGKPTGTHLLKKDTRNEKKEQGFDELKDLKELDQRKFVKLD